MEYISPEGYRLDGRRTTEMRKCEMEINFLNTSDGSARVRMGNTIVEAVVFGPLEGRRRNREGAELMVSYSQATFATRKRREQMHDRTMIETAELLKQMYEQVIITKLLPETMIDLRVQIMQDDGSVTAAVINACTLALIDAGIPMIDIVSAAEGGYIDGKMVVDMNKDEENVGTVFNVHTAIMQKSGAVALLQTEGKMPLQRLGDLLSIVEEGAKTIGIEMKKRIREYGIEVLSYQTI
ncbi:exosome complex exonuclease RRP41, putative [Entamoeba dispar SAW760]|uniref:Exosome complex exonuclease RRP41, putative n=1 Tax=Entamoeba dispar (strain ATCC PRA-260 / SAW760) TaxID=370354 RepID=B0ERA1_ENTDS|nr:exosome complex exonuclease RRP41, putative [Entamoeba dispar SAW760]EDR22949.1 exosome complex exonuclease RRP41, putative [Entamoeba dispar SAW760]|eukprot:EDR22949.1 exosome complex exonuclease RRP41, putative [Entamoeba dispar SAW760]